MAVDSAIIIEDHADTALLLEHLIRSAGFTPTVFPTFEAALAQAVSHPPCIVLADVQVDGKMGLDAFVRNLRKAHARVPVILVSGDAKIHEHAQNVKADGVLMKPFELDAFTDLIAKHCKN